MKYLAIIAALWAAPVVAQPCGPVTQVVRSLVADHHEKVVAEGKLASGFTMYVFSNPVTKHWTVITVSPQGIACLAAAGHRFELTSVETL